MGLQISGRHYFGIRKSSAGPASPSPAKRKPDGFTLLELVVYTGILAIVGVFIAGILSQTARIYTENRARIEVVQNLRSASQMLQHSIQQARGIDTAVGTTLRLLMPAPAEDPTAFTLDTVARAITRQRATASPERITSRDVRVTDLNFSIVSAALLPVDPAKRWAWNGNGLGWIDFSPPDGGVRVPMGAGALVGFARIHNIPGNDGLIAVNCATAGNCAHAYHVNVDDAGQLAGWAWNSAFGWISFCGNSAGGSTWDGTRWVCPASPTYGVNLNRLTGDLAGWAWMANFGWISFCGNSAGGSTWDGTRWACPASPTYGVAVQHKVGRPLNAIQIRMTMEYDTLNPLLAYSETYDFAIVLTQPVIMTVTGITPASGVSGTTVSGVQITGSNFIAGATVRLRRPGHVDIDGTGFTLSGGALVGGSFNLAGAARGTWDVGIENPDGQTGVLADGFTVTVAGDMAPIDPANRAAWNGNGLGWIDFSPPDGGVRVPMGAGALVGFARIHNIPGNDGLIAVNCATAGNCAHAYHVNVDDAGQLAGWAWNSAFGWISFCGNSAGGSTWDGTRWVCPASPTYGVNLNRLTGDLAGWAWMANFGWISFCGTATGGSTWDGTRWACPASPLYKVAIH